MAASREEAGLDIDKSLFMAAGQKEGLESVKYFVAEGAYVNKIDPDHTFRPVFYAAQFGSLDAVRYLIEECKADITKCYGSLCDKNLLEMAAYFDEKDQAKLHYIGQYYREFKDGTTELHVAVLTQDFSKIAFNLEVNPKSLLVKNNQNKSPISYIFDLAKWDILVFCIGVLAKSPDPSMFVQVVEELLIHICDSIKAKDDKNYNSLRQVLLNVMSIEHLQRTPIGKLIHHFFQLFEKLLDQNSKIEVSALEPILKLAHAINQYPFSPKFILKITEIADRQTWNEILLQIAITLAKDCEVQFRSHLYFKLMDHFKLRFKDKPQDQLADKFLLVAQQWSSLQEMKTFPEDIFSGYINEKDWYDCLKDLENNKMIQAAIMVLQIIMRYSKKTELEKAKYRFVLARYHFLLEQRDVTKQVLAEFKKDDTQPLEDEPANQLLKLSFAAAKKDVVDILREAYLIDREKFKERLKALFKDVDTGEMKMDWDGIYSLLKVFYQQGIYTVLLPNTIIGKYHPKPFMYSAVKDGQDKIVKLFFQYAANFPQQGKELLEPNSAWLDSGTTLLYAAAAEGNVALFTYIFDNNIVPIRKLYEPELKQEGMTPILHNILWRSNVRLPIIESYYEIVRMIVEKFPEELLHICSRNGHNWTVWDILKDHSSSMLIRNVFEPILNSAADIKRELLQSQIQICLISNETVERLLSGTDVLHEFCLEEKSEPISDISQFLWEKIETLKHLVEIEIGSPNNKVNAVFYFNTFLPWVLKCRRHKEIVAEGQTPVIGIKVDDKLLDDINKAVKFVTDLYSIEQRSSHKDQPQRVCLQKSVNKEFKDSKQNSGNTVALVDSKQELPKALPGKFFDKSIPLASAAAASVAPLDEEDNGLTCDG